MAGPGGRIVSRVSTRVLPNTSQFLPRLRSFLERVEKRLKINIPIDLDGIPEFEAKMEAATRDREVDVEVNDEGIGRALTRSERLRESLRRVGRTGERAGRRLFDAFNFKANIREELEDFEPKLRRIGVAAGGAQVLLGGMAIALLAIASPGIVGGLLALPALIAPIGGAAAVVALGFEGIKNAASEAGDEVERVSGGISGLFDVGLRDDFEDLGNLLVNLEDELFELARAVIFVSDEFTEFLTAPEQEEQLSDITDDLSEALRALSPVIESATGFLLDLIENGLNALQDTDFEDFNKAWQGLKDTLKELTEEENLELLLDNLDEILATVTLLVDGFLEFTLVMAKVNEAIEDYIELFEGDLVGQSVVHFKQAFKDLYVFALEITYLLELGWEEMTEAIEEAWDDAIESINDALSDWLDGFTNGLGDAVVGNTMASKAVVSDWTAAGGTLRTIWAGVTDYVTSRIDRWRSVFSRVVASIKVLWKGLSSALKAGIDRVVAVIQALPGRAAAAFGNAGSVLFGAGERLISGLVAGIKAGFSRVRAVLSSLTSLLPSWKGPRERDQRILREPARLIMSGFAADLRRNFGVVQRTLGELTAGIDVRASAAGQPTTVGGTTVRVDANPAAVDGYAREVTRATITGVNQANALRARLG